MAPVFEFQGQKMIKTCRRKFIQELWEDLRGRLLTIEVEHLSSLKEYLDEIMAEISRIVIMQVLD